MTEVAVRRELRPADSAEIVALHQRVYGPEYGLDARFSASVARGIEQAIARGWPDTAGAVWLIEGDGQLSGCIGLTEERAGAGRIRWFVLSPGLRGRGIGRSLLGDALATARAAGMRTLELETFSRLTAAAHLYRDAGFRVESSHQTEQWGPAIVLQRYALELR
ncbi:MAG: GNAT family N-acetyltransferase [Solirubrobacterales bacterium]|nr:GNAT family N-acetyltransferase [Solirubrobacterales bacterium]